MVTPSYTIFLLVAISYTIPSSTKAKDVLFIESVNIEPFSTDIEFSLRTNLSPEPVEFVSYILSVSAVRNILSLLIYSLIPPLPIGA